MTYFKVYFRNKNYGSFFNFTYIKRVSLRSDNTNVGDGKISSRTLDYFVTYNQSLSFVYMTDSLKKKYIVLKFSSGFTPVESFTLNQLMISRKRVC